MITIEDYVSDQNMALESFMLSQITPQESLKLLDFMRGHLPGPKSLNPEMTREESNEMSELFDKLRAVLVCRSMSNEDNDNNVEVTHAD